MANTRDNRLSGKTTEDGALVSVPVSVGDWLGYDDDNTTAINAVVEALTPLMPHGTMESKKYHDIYLRGSAGFKWAGIERVNQLHVSDNGLVWLATHKPTTDFPDKWLDGDHFVAKFNHYGGLSREIDSLEWLWKQKKPPDGLVRVLKVIDHEEEYLPGASNFSILVMEVLEPVPLALEDAGEEEGLLEGLSLPVILARFQSLLETLVFCHENKLVHGDVNPDNVMVRPSKNGSPSTVGVLIDFGLSNCIEPGVHARGVSPYCARRGKTPFMPPEMVRGEYLPPAPPVLGDWKWPQQVKWDDDPKIDSWGAGSVLASWLTGLKFPLVLGQTVVSDESVMKGYRSWIKEGKGTELVRKIWQKKGALEVLIDGVVKVMNGLLTLDTESRWSVEEAFKVFSALRKKKI